MPRRLRSTPTCGTPIVGWPWTRLPTFTPNGCPLPRWSPLTRLRWEPTGNKTGSSVSVRPGVGPWELPSPAVPAQGGQALVAAERAGQADQDGRPSGAALPSIDLSVVRGVCSSTVVRGSVGSYRPVIAGAKLREGTTTILPRGRALQGVGLSSMRFHPTGGEPKATKTDK